MPKEPVTPSVSADRGPPAPVKPVTHKGVRYEARSGDRGVLVAVDARSGRELWRVLLVDTWVDARLEGDVQDVFLKRLTLIKGVDELEAEDERGRVYRVDLASRTFRIVKWPVETRVVKWKRTTTGWQYWVRLTVTNTLNRPLTLDPFSVARGGSVTNDLFRVRADGAPVAYSGDLVSRLPTPEKDLIVVKPGKSYEVEVELTDSYSVPPGARALAVGFEHRNHSSPDAFVMFTPHPHELELSGGGPPGPKPRPE